MSGVKDIYNAVAVSIKAEIKDSTDMQRCKRVFLKSSSSLSQKIQQMIIIIEINPKTESGAPR
jgi:hypothetical protein